MVGSWSSASLRSENLAGTVWLSAGAPGVTSRPFSKTAGLVGWCARRMGAWLGGTGLTRLGVLRLFLLSLLLRTGQVFSLLGGGEPEGQQNCKRGQTGTQGAHGVLL